MIDKKAPQVPYHTSGQTAQPDSSSVECHCSASCDEMKTRTQKRSARSVHPWSRVNAGFGSCGAAESEPCGDLRQKLSQDLLPLGEHVLHLAANEHCVGKRSQHTHSNFVVDHISDAGSVKPVARFGRKFMPVVPVLEGAFILHIGEMMMPFEFGDARDPLGAQRQKRNDAE